MKSKVCVICGSESCQHRLCSAYDKAMLGTIQDDEGEYRYVYSKDKIIKILVRNGISNKYNDATGVSDAEEFFDYNIVGSTSAAFVEKV